MISIKGYQEMNKEETSDVKKFLVIQCLNCAKYLVQNDDDSQIDCPFCGYSNELTDIRIDWWEVYDKNFAL
jgi:predicted nucleic-acid-binding Zn-ribbon protein